jgi:integrase
VVRKLQYISRHPKSGVFRFRRDVPPHLRDILRQKVFTESLDTKVAADAFRRGLAVVARYQKLFDDAEAVHRQRAAGQPVEVALTLGEAAAAVDRWREAELARIASVIASRPRGLSATDTAIERYVADLTHPLATRKLLADAAQGYSSGTAVVDTKVEEIGRANGFVLPRHHPMHATVAAMVRTAWAAITEQEETWARGSWSVDNLPVSVRRHLIPEQQQLAAALVTAAPARKRQKSIRDMLGWYCRERRPKASATTRSEQRLAIDRLCGFMGGDVPVHTITLDHAEGFFKAVSAQPRAMTKVQKDMGLRDLAAWMASDGRGLARVSLGTVVKQVRLLSAMMAEAVVFGYADTNPFPAVIPHDADEMGVRRAPFSPEDLGVIFGAPLFQGCRDDAAWNVPGTYRIMDHRRWMPLLLMTTGARLEEVGQLLVRDIKDEGGILYIHVTDLAEGDDEEAKAVKTTGSRRRVPLHRIVLEAGFRQHLDRMARSGGEALFPALERDSRGKKTREFSKWFNQKFLEKVGITSRAKVLYSFRHLFKDRCREADLGEELHDALTGHAKGGVGRGYGAGFSVRRFAEGMERVEFPGYPSVPSPVSPPGGS